MVQNRNTKMAGAFSIVTRTLSTVDSIATEVKKGQGYWSTDKQFTKEPFSMVPAMVFEASQKNYKSPAGLCGLLYSEIPHISWTSPSF